MSLRSILALVPASLAAACAGTSTSPQTGDRAAAERETDCLRTSLVTDWDALDERNLIVYESGRRPYHVELAQTCFGLDFANMIALYDRSNDERICGYGLDRVVVDQTIPDSCSVAAVDELTDEQAEALKARAEAAPTRR
jgi:hypothetical protein